LPNVVTPVGSEGGGYATKRVQYAGDLFFAEAEAFIEQNRAQPFFLYLALVVPHANNERSKELGDGQEVPDYGIYSEQPWHSSVKGQAAMVTRMDEGVGKVLAKLKQLGLAENTLVLFSSDNGPHKEGGPSYDPEFFDANGPFTGIKRSLTDGGIRVPFLAWWPGKVKAGAVSDHVGYFGDMMATFADLSGAKAPAKLDSLSLAPTLLGQGQQAKHEFLYWEFYEKGVNQAVLLNGRWKGIRLQKTTAPIALYDLKNDVAEQTDLAAKYPDLVGRIGTIMRTERYDNEHWKLADAPVAPGKAKARAKK
jgi:arylsulfatase A-like enzyme